ncbi:pimeloyl-ACP methyl esterase BioG family protein [uncultured Roseibium sp.]|uniref:pimeloyl-ACP methyl esterase BioG family protein n=1 Tax=uncultured Roseibium sp. TaxID=1936171 RepID=UPI00261CF744|nr:pimeloyl-ACP methyl esterase BioG family protein [uncultured Roseibium sp.]
MRLHWLRKSGSARLILAFGGWVLGPSIFRNMTGSEDVLFVEDYRQLDLDPGFIETYDEVYLLAYSFGVVSALHWLANVQWKPARLVAVNGTAYPADREKGIPPELLKAAADGLSVSSLARFTRRCGSASPPAEFDIKAAREELHFIADRGPARELPFDRIWISTGDRIISAHAQEAGWARQRSVVRHIASFHQPFNQGQSWGDWFN